MTPVNIIQAIGLFILENAERAPNRALASKLLSWVPYLTRVTSATHNVGDSSYFNCTDVFRFAEKGTDLYRQLYRLSDIMAGAIYLRESRDKKALPHVSNRDLEALYQWFRDIRNLPRYNATLRLPASYPECADWEMREARRFTTGEYEEVPWMLEFDPIPGHYVHFSKKSTDGLVAYTQNAEKGAADRQTPLKPGKYLKANYPDMHLDKIRDYVAMCDTANQLMFTNTGPEVENVYMTGPSSCMVKTLDSFKYQPPVHPVHVYADGDLKLAYLRDRSGKITARGLVWPDKKLMGRLYGDIQRLQEALVKAGYTNRSNDGSELAGAKLKLIKYKRKDDPTREWAVMPYIDGDAMRYISFDGDYAILGDRKGGSGFNCGPEDGGIRLPAFRECPLSKKKYDLDAVPFVVLEDTRQEVARDPCVSNGLIFQCQKSQKYYSMAVDHGRVAVSWDKASGKMTYEVWLADEVGKMAYTCAKTGELFAKQYMPPVILADGSKVSPSWFAAQASQKKAA